MKATFAIVKREALGLARETLRLTWELFRLMIPVILVVKLLEELGFVVLLSHLLAPIMGLVGLPPETGLIWATTMLVNIYGGMVVFATLPLSEPLTVAQVTVLGTMMLIAHSLPVEGRIAQKAGLGLGRSLALRVGSAFFLGWGLNWFYTHFDLLGEANVALWQPEPQTDGSLLAWAISQAKVLGQIFLIIAALVVLLYLLKISGVERLFARLLRPFLRFMGLGEQTVTIAIIGMTLGLTYGGALLINEARKGTVPPRELAGAMALLSLCHGLIEDTLLMVLIGGDLTGLLYARVLFSLLAIAVFMRMPRLWSAPGLRRG